MRKSIVIAGRLLSLLVGVTILERLVRSVATVVGLQGIIGYERAGLAGRGTLYIGAQILPDDHLFPESGASLVIACPDGSTRSFVAGELFPNDVVQCPGDTQLVGEAGQRHPYVQRGGRQDPSIPYLISPRACVVRSPRPELIWNPVSEAKAYQITLRGGSAPWSSGDLDPAKVVRDGAAHLSLPIDVEPRMPYTVEICVRYPDTLIRCTTDPDWASPVNLAFSFVPTPGVDAAEKQIIDKLGTASLESLYTRAVLLSQSVYTPPGGEAMGFYNEAITLLEKLTAMDGRGSPGVFHFLGSLYLRVGLPISAARQFKRALDIAPVGTEAAAQAALGLALSTPDSDAVINYFNAALEHYRAHLTLEAYKTLRVSLCAQIGDLRDDIAACQDQ